MLSSQRMPNPVSAMSQPNPMIAQPAMSQGGGVGTGNMGGVSGANMGGVSGANMGGVSGANIIVASPTSMMSVPADNMNTPQQQQQQQTVISAQQANILTQNPNMQIRMSQPGLQTSQPMVVQTDNQSNRVTQLPMTMLPNQSGMVSNQQFLQNPSSQPQVGIPGSVSTPGTSPVGVMGAEGQKGLALQLQGKKIIWRGEFFMR